MTFAAPAIQARFGVTGIPTLLLLRDGAGIDRIVGAVPEATLRQHLDAALVPQPR